MKRCLWSIVVLLVLVLCSCTSGRVEKPLLNVIVRDGKVYQEGLLFETYTVPEGKTGSLRVTPRLEEGEVDLVVYQRGKEEHPLYQGRNLEFSFTLGLPEEGMYEARVTYHQAVGELGLEWSVQ